MERPSERGQSLILWSLVLIFVILPMLAFTIDQGSLYWARRARQKATDAACLNGAIASRLGNDARAQVVTTLTNHDLDKSYWEPEVGTGESLSKGIENSGGEIRVAVWGPTLSWFSQFIPGFTGWEIGARSRCDMGIAGPLPLTLKECELAEDAEECIDSEGNINYAPDWEWGDEMYLAGQKHDPNISTSMSFAGLVAPDIRCVNPDDECDEKWYIPPVEEDTSSNTVKEITRQYIRNRGYTGPAPVPGERLGALDGASTAKLVQAIDETYDVGDIVFVMVYEAGEVHDGNQNYDYATIEGYTFVRITQITANNVKVVPIDIGNCNSGPTPEDDIIDSPDDSPFNLNPVLLPWDYGLGGAGSAALGLTCS